MTMPPPSEDEIIRLLHRKLREGFTPRGSIASHVAAMLACDEQHLVKAGIEKWLPVLTTEFEAEQRTWPAVTDCDRLDAAFEELNATGILARHNWTCCGNCGCGAIHHEFAKHSGSTNEHGITGYVFYHEQDTESAVDGHGIALNYGSFIETDDDDAYDRDSVSVAKRACETLKMHGLTTIWNGTIEKRVFVEMRWQRRERPNRFCEELA
jgi:hypothetical protein